MVVAGEVKSLAAQTAKATGEIEQQIAEIRTATHTVVGAMREVGSRISQVETVVEMIATTVEQQASATKEIAGSVHAVTQATLQAKVSMRNVSRIASIADTASRSVVAAAETVTGTATALQTEVNDFLSSMSNSTDERRSYERIDGNGCRGKMTIGSGRDLDTTVRDISRSGAALQCSREASAGTEMTVTLFNDSRQIRGRVASRGQGVIAMTCLQDAANLAVVDKALCGIGRLG